MLLPTPDCSLCPRLAAFLEEKREQLPGYHNEPVPSFGHLDATILIVGLAPGLHGANQTGRPFTGDYAGDVLYKGLLDCGFATGQYLKRPDDGLTLKGIRITNAVRCVPPENKPTTQEINTCNRFLNDEMASMPNLTTLLTLGTIAHKAVLRTLGEKQSAYAFGHGNVHMLKNGLRLVNSYHCSRYNINTGRLTQAMFNEVLEKLSL